MFSTRLISLVRSPRLRCQKVRGMATLKDIRGRLDSVVIDKQKITQTLKIMAKELGPPSPTEIPQIVKDGRRLLATNWSQLTVREAFLGLLVTADVSCWFFVGECIGKGTLIGYQV